MQAKKQDNSILEKLGAAVTGVVVGAAAGAAAVVAADPKKRKEVVKMFHKVEKIVGEKLEEFKEEATDAAKQFQKKVEEKLES